ncbi:hypothetical protein [uncultured Endozoicomonas sp.]|uniref:hypothetical protein n=1 Tax=uncultured Endozoicomonas sp. TaxID=432652 RepID=UPI00260FBE49|nr:hypothetical protein [uncultured Endozoicomonas sp.]
MKTNNDSVKVAGVEKHSFLESAGKLVGSLKTTAVNGGVRTVQNMIISAKKKLPFSDKSEYSKNNLGKRTTSQLDADLQDTNSSIKRSASLGSINSVESDTSDYFSSTSSMSGSQEHLERLSVVEGSDPGTAFSREVFADDVGSTLIQLRDREATIDDKLNDIEESVESIFSHYRVNKDQLLENKKLLASLRGDLDQILSVYERKKASVQNLLEDLKSEEFSKNDLDDVTTTLDVIGSEIKQFLKSKEEFIADIEKLEKKIDDKVETLNTVEKKQKSSKVTQPFQNEDSVLDELLPAFQSGAKRKNRGREASRKEKGLSGANNKPRISRYQKNQMLTRERAGNLFEQECEELVFPGSDKNKIDLPAVSADKSSSDSASNQVQKTGGETDFSQKTFADEIENSLIELKRREEDLNQKFDDLDDNIEKLLKNKAATEADFLNQSEIAEQIASDLDRILSGYKTKKNEVEALYQDLARTNIAPSVLANVDRTILVIEGMICEFSSERDNSLECLKNTRSQIQAGITGVERRKNESVLFDLTYYTTRIELEVGGLTKKKLAVDSAVRLQANKNYSDVSAVTGLVKEMDALKVKYSEVREKVSSKLKALEDIAASSANDKFLQKRADRAVHLFSITAKELQSTINSRNNLLMGSINLLEKKKEEQIKLKNREMLARLDGVEDIIDVAFDEKHGSLFKNLEPVIKSIAIKKIDELSKILPEDFQGGIIKEGISRVKTSLDTLSDKPFRVDSESESRFGNPLQKSIINDLLIAKTESFIFDLIGAWNKLGVSAAKKFDKSPSDPALKQIIGIVLKGQSDPEFARCTGLKETLDNVEKSILKEYQNISRFHAYKPFTSGDLFGKKASVIADSIDKSLEKLDDYDEVVLGRKLYKTSQDKYSETIANVFNMSARNALDKLSDIESKHILNRAFCEKVSEVRTAIYNDYFASRIATNIAEKVKSVFFLARKLETEKLNQDETEDVAAISEKNTIELKALNDAELEASVNEKKAKHIDRPRSLAERIGDRSKVLSKLRDLRSKNRDMFHEITGVISLVNTKIDIPASTQMKIDALYRKARII